MKPSFNTPELQKLISALDKQIDPLLMNHCSSATGELGCQVKCVNKVCEPSDTSSRTKVVLFPGEAELLESKGYSLEEKETVVLADELRPCKFLQNGACKLGRHRPFSCRTFPVAFAQNDLRSITLFIMSNCPAIDATTEQRIVLSLNRLIRVVATLWPFIPTWWHDQFSDSFRRIKSIEQGTLAFDIDNSDLVEYTSDKGPQLVSSRLLQSLADADCVVCSGFGVDSESLRYGKPEACGVCAGPRFWNADYHTVQEQSSREEVTNGNSEV